MNCEMAMQLLSVLCSCCLPLRATQQRVCFSPTTRLSTSSFHSPALQRAKMCELVLYCITAFKLQMSVAGGCRKKRILSATFGVRGHQI
ncbi:hypothetical protein CEXT_654811 [Caerostris extrusa]|uniref:Secreted protein n=1 Tax=Caerostris extrusa TaxID=172846 RepID=A0AAV4MUG6_CAEEX|nr:hypothetical protein CEXT_654811 [Caerostris extrusa]